MFINQTRITHLDYLLGFLFIVLCNFTSANIIPGKTFILGGICILYIIKKRKMLYVKGLIICILSYVFIGLLHYKYYGELFRRPIIDLPLLLLSGFFITKHLGCKFPYVYFNILFYLSSVSLFFFGLMIFTGIIPDIPFISEDGYKGIFFYNIRWNEIIDKRNCGPFWEPGAFGGYLVCVAILYFNKLGWLWKRHKKKCIIILITILTTFSTQAYLSLFLVIVLYKIGDKLSFLKILGMILLSSIILILAYINIPFLGNKLDEQIVLSQNVDDHDSMLSANRFTTFIIEMSIFSESPFIGKTANQEILYGDYPFILSEIDRNGGYGSGSGISTNLAAYGMFPFLIWLLLSFDNLKKQIGFQSTIVCLFVLLCLGNAEQYSDQILFLSIPFIVYSQDCKRYHVYQ